MPLPAALRSRLTPAAFVVLLSAVLLPATAAAHPGHLADVAGHDHWVAGVAIGLAVLAGLWGALKGRRKDEAAPEEAETSDEEQAA